MLECRKHTTICEQGSDLTTSTETITLHLSVPSKSLRGCWHYSLHNTVTVIWIMNWVFFYRTPKLRIEREEGGRKREEREKMLWKAVVLCSCTRPRFFVVGFFFYNFLISQFCWIAVTFTRKKTFFFKCPSPSLWHKANQQTGNSGTQDVGGGKGTQRRERITKG